MRIASFTVYGIMNGSIIVELGNNTHLNFELTNEEAESLRAVARQIVEARQAEFAKAVVAPFPILADFSEI
jgi:hypothetical protein